MTNDARIRSRFAALATTIFIASLFSKTFIFAGGNEPVVLNYVTTTLLLTLGGALLLPRAREIPVDPVAGGLLVVAILWTAFSGFESGVLLNLVATVTFLIAAVGSGFILPALVFVARREPTTIIRNVLAVMSVASIILLIFVPDFAVDRESGRIAGAYVSVAVASSMFGFAAILALRSTLVSSNRFSVWMWGGVTVISFLLLYLTRTRSSLVEVLGTALLIVTFTPLSRGVRLIVISLTGLLFVAAATGAAVVTTGVVVIDEQLAEFRLADSGLSASRGGNWDFGIARIQASPLFGEGLLSKQTHGGTTGVDFSGATSYDPTYDPHSLVLSFGVEGGVPFILLMTALLFLIPARFVKAFGWKTALQTPEFVIASARLTVSVFSGGDMTTLGNVVEKTIWILLGTMMIKSELKLRNDRAAVRLLPAPSARWARGGVTTAMTRERFN